ncbi:hypothetical protein AB2B41_05620 [Marimonas sp. MJW-29]|uniref:Uncharacterized protein n=1 Tax=Sulfitobacter sediminis TaxID=3234186 RepID=A0ABV3RJD6_9RHOB
MLSVLITVLVLWMIACAWCGFQRRYLRFLAVLIAGLVLNFVWMITGLQADPFEPNVVIAQASATLYALCAFSVGWFAARIRQAWRDTRP